MDLDDRSEREGGSGKKLTAHLTKVTPEPTLAQVAEQIYQSSRGRAIRSGLLILEWPRNRDAYTVISHIAELSGTDGVATYLTRQSLKDAIKVDTSFLEMPHLGNC